MNMKNAEDNIYNVYEMCRTAGILHIDEVLNSSYKNEYSRCMLDFIYVTLFSHSNSYSVNILGDAMDIAADICTAILYSKKSEGFDKSFTFSKKDLFRFLTRVIHNRLVDLLRKDGKKKAKEQLSYDEDEIIEDTYCMVTDIENTDRENELINKVLKITNLFSVFCFLLIRYYGSYKPKEIFAMLEGKVTTDEEFKELAVNVLKKHGYHLNLNSLNKIGYINKPTSPKAISDAASYAAKIFHANIHNFGIDKRLIDMYEEATKKSK